MITLTEKAAQKLLSMAHAAGEDQKGLRISVVGGGCSGLSYEFAIDAPKQGDLVFTHFGAIVMTDPKSHLRLAGATVDYNDNELRGAGFFIENPNAKGGCGCGSSFTA
ncbi:MAG: iron-sulfur cluster assembly accessory protein [bacterium]|nr:iron-sulfur cluster assembly accessory protein [bacterium]